MTKTGRNDPCPCGSGKKYKKCCELKEAASKKIMAHRIEGENLVKKASNISGLFQQLSSLPPIRLKEGSVNLEEKPQEASPEEDLEPPTQEPTEKP